VSEALIGAGALHKRLRAIGSVAVRGGMGRNSLVAAWQKGTVAAAKTRIPRGPTGETQRSIRPGRGATVVGKYTINFIDAGSKAHTEPRSNLTPTGRVSRRKRNLGRTGQPLVLKFNKGGHIMFRKKVNKPSIAAHPFKKWAGEQGVRKVPWNSFITGLWNRAA
jgi:hypothetical protein